MFYLLMKMFLTSTHVQLKSSTKLLIVKVRTPGPGAEPRLAVSSRKTLP